MDNFLFAQVAAPKDTKAGDPVPVEISSTTKDYLVQRVYADVAANAFGVLIGLLGAMIAIWLLARYLGLKEILTDWAKSTTAIAQNVEKNTLQIGEMRQDINRLTDRLDRSSK